MVDITIVSMGFINQQTYLQGPTLYHVLACFVTIEDALPCARRSLVINQAFCLLLICSTNSYVNPLNPNFIVKTYLNNNVWIYIYIYLAISSELTAPFVLLFNLSLTFQPQGLSLCLVQPRVFT